MIMFHFCFYLFIEYIIMNLINSYEQIEKNILVLFILEELHERADRETVCLEFGNYPERKETVVISTLK